LSDATGARRVLARYSAPKILVIAVVLALLIALAAYLQLSFHPYSLETLSTAPGPRVLLGDAVLAAGAIACGVGLWRLAFRRGEAVWVEDGKLIWGALRRSIPVADIKSVTIGTGRYESGKVMIGLVSGDTLGIGVLLLDSDQYRLRGQIAKLNPDVRASLADDPA
jgi:hypothetical protein